MTDQKARLLVLEVYVITLMLQCIVVVPTWPHLFGDRTNSMFDIWLLGHFMFGVIVTGMLAHIKVVRISKVPLLIWVLGVLVMWEAIELSTEMGSLGEQAMLWKHGYEHWSNRFIADPLVGLLGYMAHQRRPRIFFPMLVLGIIWEIVQVSQPTSMSIQDWLIAYL